MKIDYNPNEHFSFMIHEIAYDAIVIGLGFAFFLVWKDNS